MGNFSIGYFVLFYFPNDIYEGLLLTTASREALMVSLIPTIALISGVFFIVEKMSIYKSLGCIIAFLGVAIDVSSGLLKTVFSSGKLLGDFFMFAAII